MTKKKFKELHKNGKLELLAIPFSYRTIKLYQSKNNPETVLESFLYDIQGFKNRYIKGVTNYSVDGKQYAIKEYGRYIVVLENVKNANIPNIEYDMTTYIRQ